MKDILNTALCMLNDRHIEEAATYTPQLKAIRFRKILPVAVCFLLVIVSAFAVKDYISPYIVPTETTGFSDPHTTTIGGVIPPDVHSTTVAGVTDKSTTVAYAPEGTSTTMPTTTSAGIHEKPEIELFCTTPAKDYTGWENHAFLSYYHQINIGETSYLAEKPLSASKAPLSEEKLGSLLYEFKWSDYRFKIDGSGDFAVDVYEIKGYSAEEAVAVGRRDGLMKGYYAYYRMDAPLVNLPDNILANCHSLADIISYADIDVSTAHNPENFFTSYWVHYKENGKEDDIYSICVQDMEELASLIINNKDVKAETRTSNTGEKLTYNAYLKGQLCEIYLCNDGYLYISTDTITRAFNIGTKIYEAYVNKFKYAHYVWTPENPVTLG